MPSLILRHGLRVGLKAGLGATVTLYWVTKHGFTTPLVNSQSMAPTLNPSTHETGKRDRVLVDIMGTTWLDRGMIVTFYSPQKTDRTLAIKRIVALHGDTVVSRSGEKVEVPKNHVWVEGDNGDNSCDSNNYGPSVLIFPKISARLIQGRVSHILLPFSRFRRLNWEKWDDGGRVEPRPEGHRWPKDWEY